MNRIPRTLLLRRLLSKLRESAGDEIPASAGRREFLRVAALAGAGALAGCADGAGSSGTEKKTVGPVAVVGGGAAGLVAAWRLMRAGVEVHLYEASGRFGGRMWTRKNFNAAGMFCEFGGELVDTGHTPLIGLAEELGVGVRRFQPEGVEEPGRYFIDGHLYTDADLIPAFALMAKRVAADTLATVSDDPDEFTDKARAFDATPLSEYLRTLGRDTGAPAWLLRALEIAYVTEYGVAASRQSAMNFLGMISPDTSSGFKIYGESDETFRIAGGSGSLTDELARRIADGAKVWENHRLSAIADDGEKITLTFDLGEKGFVVGRKRAYSRVVLALPFPLLREVSGWDALALSDAKKKAVRELGMGENVKVMFGVNAAFMKTLRASGGAGVFSDTLFECWETSRAQPGDAGILTCFLGGPAARAFVADGPSRYLDELERVFPGVKAAHDGNEAHFDWPRFAFAKGSFSATLVGQYCGMITDAAASELGGRLIFAGEHTSENSSGYMNGAVESGERAAREILV